MSLDFEEIFNWLSTFELLINCLNASEVLQLNLLPEKLLILLLQLFNEHLALLFLFKVQHRKFLISQGNNNQFGAAFDQSFN